ncbi:WD repeat-containing protein 27 isoform X2 [Scleropages formosus]|uniref:WD repeat-containing protein 27 isoform X2 n=1 Tax=Scleropages formosus TaxID=113540 RepID=UPI0008787541|nr:WD repeat-containing protein 27 isoform X2 [Scleropages formosus]
MWGHSGEKSLEDECPVVTERFASSCGVLVSRVQLACCPTHCAYPWQGKELRVHSTTHQELEPLHLIGHHENISAVIFGNGTNPLTLYSASRDYIISWDIERCYSSAEKGVIAQGTVIGTLLGNVHHLSMCPGDKRAAACVADKIYILSTKKEEVLQVLEGHLGSVTSAEFCSWDENIVISVSEDRTFVVWDLIKEDIIYQSAVLSAFPLLSLNLCEENRQLIIGSADEQVWCFTLPDDHKCCLVSKTDLHKVAQRRQKLLDGKTEHAGRPQRKHTDGMETSKPVLRIAAFRLWLDSSEKQDRSRSCFWMGSYDGLYLINMATSELYSALVLRDHTNLSISMAASWTIAYRENGNALCMVASLFDPCVALLEVRVHGLLDSHSGLSGLENLSVIPSTPPMPESPLKAELIRKDSRNTSKKTDVKGGVKNHPLVFHSCIKSSGYTAPNRRTMFNPETNKKNNPRPVKSKKTNGRLFVDYPANTAAPSVLHAQLSMADRPTPICSLQYSGDGKQILCGLRDGSALLYKSSLADASTIYTGHDGPVSTVGWCHSRQWFLTAAEDRTLKVWPAGVQEPALTLGSDRFPMPVKCAQFFYLDKFLLLASASTLYLYLYHLDVARDDIRRYQQKSLVKLAGTFQTSTGTNITCATAINEFYSYIVLVCGKDRSVTIFDMNTGSISASIPDSHTKAAHHISQNKGSMFCSQDAESYNLFLTSAITDGVKLWDMRTLRWVKL